MIDRYFFWRLSQWFGQWHPVDLIAVLLALMLIIWMWRKARDPLNTFDPSDFLKDAYSNKAAASALVYLSMAFLSAWYIVRETVNGGDQSNTLLLVLGVFVAKAGADRAISAWGSRVPDVAPVPKPVDDVPSDASASPAPAATVDVKTTVTTKKK